MSAVAEAGSGIGSPRPETPEPGSQQGRRNSRFPSVQLLDDDGQISEKVRFSSRTTTSTLPMNSALTRIIRK